MLFVEYIKGLDLNIKCDGIILSSDKYSLGYDNLVTLDELIELTNEIKKSGKLCALNIERIIEEHDIDEFYGFLDKISNIAIDYIIFSDLSVLNFFSKRSHHFKFIYDSKTMITNYRVAGIYSSLIDSEVICSLSNEITLEDVKEIASKAKCMLEVYGHHRIFYSRRRVFDSYKDYMSDDQKINEFDFSNKLLYIKEENRDQLYPIYQVEYGTFVHNSKKLMILDELDELSNIEIFRINSLGMTKEQLSEVSSLYFDYLNGNRDNVRERLLELDSNVANEFLYQKSILVKEGNK